MIHDQRYGYWLPSIKSQTIQIHDDVIKWKHFPRYWPFVRGIHRWPVNSPHKGQWRGALMFSLICAWINGWVNNGEAGDLRRHRAHYYVNVMCGCGRPHASSWASATAMMAKADWLISERSQPNGMYFPSLIFGNHSETYSTRSATRNWSTMWRWLSWKLTVQEYGQQPHVLLYKVRCVFSKDSLGSIISNDNLWIHPHYWKCQSIYRQTTIGDGTWVIIPISHRKQKM